MLSGLTHALSGVTSTFLEFQILGVAAKQIPRKHDVL